MAAREQPGFRELIEASRVVATVPAAPGWSVQADDGSWDAPIALWIVDQRGMVAPVPGLREPYLEAEVGVSTKVGHQTDVPAVHRPARVAGPPGQPLKACGPRQWLATLGPIRNRRQEVTPDSRWLY